MSCPSCAFFQPYAVNMYKPIPQPRFSHRFQLVGTDQVLRRGKKVPNTRLDCRRPPRNYARTPSLKTGWLTDLPFLNPYFAGLVTNSIYSVDFSQLRIGVKCAFSTNAQPRFASVVVDSVLGPPRLARHTYRCPCISVVPEATHEASRRPEKGAVTAQKVLRGSETETRELLGGTEENSVSLMRGH